MRKYIEQAKLALAEPAGESQPFIIGGSGWFLKRWDANSNALELTELPWEAARMAKVAAHASADTVAEHTDQLISVYGWREETEKFIQRSEELIEAMGA